MINWQLAKQGIRWPVSPNCIAHSGVDLARSSTFLKLCAGKLLVFKWSQAQFHFLNVYMKHVFMSRWPHTIKILISNQPQMRKFSQLFKNTGGVDLLLPRSWVQFLCCDWSKFHRWVYAENLCSILKLVYFDSWSWQSFESTCDVFNCLFPLDVQNEIQLLSRVFCYSWLVCLLVVWLRDASLVKVGNLISDGIVFVFHFAWCILKRVQNSQAILALLDSFQELQLEW